MYNSHFCTCRRVALIVVSIVMLVVTFLGLGNVFIFDYMFLNYLLMY
jgi:hypothetical protein